MAKNLVRRSDRVNIPSHGSSNEGETCKWAYKQEKGASIPVVRWAASLGRGKNTAQQDAKKGSRGADVPACLGGSW